MINKNGITLIALVITIIIMLILVGVTVNVSLNGDFFDTAKQSVSGMSMEQIQESAYALKASVIANQKSQSNTNASVLEYKEKLLEEFNIDESSVVSNNIVELEDDYVIIIKNSRLDTEVVEKSKIYLTKDEAENIWETDGAGTITKYLGNSSNVVVPIKIGTENITKLGKTAFKDCSFITDVKIYGNIINIGRDDGLNDDTDGTFLNCTNLKNIEMYEGVQIIGGFAFRNCTSLVSITLPDSVRSIDSFTDIPERNRRRRCYILGR